MNRAEDWRPLLGYEGWVDISSLGRARCWYAPRRRVPVGLVRLTEPRSLALGKGTRPVLCVRNGSGTENVALQRAVLLAFCGRPAAGDEACHFPDRDPFNCALWNLRWDSGAENALDSRAQRTCDPRVIQRRLDGLRVRYPHLIDSVDGMAFKPFPRDANTAQWDRALERIHAARHASKSGLGANAVAAT